MLCTSAVCDKQLFVIHMHSTLISKIFMPFSIQEFSLKVKNPDQPVAAGLEVPAIVEYYTSEKGEHKDRIVLTIDGDVIEIPLIA